MADGAASRENCALVMFFQDKEGEGKTTSIPLPAGSAAPCTPTTPFQFSFLHVKGSHRDIMSARMHYGLALYSLACMWSAHEVNAFSFWTGFFSAVLTVHCPNWLPCLCQLSARPCMYMYISFYHQDDTGDLCQDFAHTARHFCRYRFGDLVSPATT